jgi:hypothetical protein
MRTKKRTTIKKTLAFILAVIIIFSSTVTDTFAVRAAGTGKTSKKYTIYTYGPISAVKDGKYIYYTGTYQNFMRYDTQTKKIEKIAELQNIPEGNGYWTNGGSNLVKHGGCFYFVWDKESGVETDCYIYRVSKSGEMTKLAKGREFVIKNNRIYYTKLNHISDSDFGNEISEGTYSMNLDGSDQKKESGIRLVTTRKTEVKSKYGTLMGKNYSFPGDPRTVKKLVFKEKSGKTRTVKKTKGYNCILSYVMAGDYIVCAYHTGSGDDAKRKIAFEKYDGTEGKIFTIGSPAGAF